MLTGTVMRSAESEPMPTAKPWSGAGTAAGGGACGASGACAAPSSRRGSSAFMASVLQEEETIRLFAPHAKAGAAKAVLGATNRTGSGAGDRHPVDAQGRRVHRLAKLEVVGRGEAPIHVEEVAGDGDFGDRRADLAILDQEAAGAPAVIAGAAVPPLPEQLGDVDAAHDVRDQRLLGDRPGFEVDVGCPCARRTGDAAHGVARGRTAKLPRRGAVHQPPGEAPAGDEVARRGRQALAVERLRAQPAAPVRIVADRDRFGEDELSLL